MNGYLVSRCRFKFPGHNVAGVAEVFQDLGDAFAGFGIYEEDGLAAGQAKPSGASFGVGFGMVYLGDNSDDVAVTHAGDTRWIKGIGFCC